MMSLFILLLGLVVGWLAKLLLDQFLEQRNQGDEPPPEDIHASVKHWLRQNNQLKAKLKQQTAINENSSRQLQQQDQQLQTFTSELHRCNTTIQAYKKTLAVKLQDMEKLQARQVRYDDTTSKLRQQLKQREQALLQQQTDYHTALTTFEQDKHEQQKAFDAYKAHAQLNKLPHKASQALSAQNKTTDDLTRIKGIGPKLSQLFRQHNITRFSELALLSPDTVREWLTAAGARFKLTTDADIQQWLEQANLAAEQRWQAFDRFGKQATSQQHNDHPRSNLSKIWGIGKKLETQLNDAGIHTYQQLITATPEHLTDIIEACHSYYPDSDTMMIFSAWQHQAELADNQQWGQLRGYQQHYRELRTHKDKPMPDKRRGISLKQPQPS